MKITVNNKIKKFNISVYETFCAFCSPLLKLYGASYGILSRGKILNYMAYFLFLDLR